MYLLLSLRQLVSFLGVAADVGDSTAREPYLDQSWRSRWWWWEWAREAWLQQRSPAPWWPPSRCSSSRMSAGLQRRSKETSHKVTQNMQQLEDGKTTRPPAGISDAPVCSQGRSTFHSSREHDVPQCLSHNTMQAAEEFTVMEDKQHSSPLYPSVFVELHVQLLKRPQTPLKVINQSSRSFKASKSGRSPNRKTRRHNGALYWRKADKREKRGLRTVEDRTRVGLRMAPKASRLQKALWGHMGSHRIWIANKRVEQ